MVTKKNWLPIYFTMNYIWWVTLAVTKQTMDWGGKVQSHTWEKSIMKTGPQFVFHTGVRKTWVQDLKEGSWAEILKFFPDIWFYAIWFFFDLIFSTIKIQDFIKFKYLWKPSKIEQRVIEMQSGAIKTFWTHSIKYTCLSFYYYEMHVLFILYLDDHKSTKMVIHKQILLPQI